MDRFARALVRWRWVVLAVWAVIGAVAAVRAPATPSLLNIRGGSARPTEASRTEDLLTHRFSRPIGEFFAVALQAPAAFDQPAPRAALDTLLAALGREPYIRGLVSYRSTGDTTFLSRDHRATEKNTAPTTRKPRIPDRENVSTSARQPVPKTVPNQIRSGTRRAATRQPSTIGRINSK